MTNMIRKERNEEILEYCDGKKVLNVGCVGRGSRLHRKISQVADHVTGIDIDEQGIEGLEKEGYNVHYADAQNFSLDEKDFEIIALGNVLGYIPNCGMVLENCNEHLISDGKIVVSILNPFSLSVFWNFELFDREDSWKNNTRFFYFSPRMFRNLAALYGFGKEKERKYIIEKLSDRPTFKSRLFFLFSAVLPDRLRSEYWLGVYEKTGEPQV